MELRKNKLNRWVSGGPYMSEKIIVRCEHCGESSLVTAESEFGATIWIPDECPKCHHPWREDTNLVIHAM